ncbi:hypothetical protein KI387_013368, partial [Taxus chinensis]
LAPKSAKVYGQVLVNGRKSKLEYGSYGYVERADELIEILTVREMLYYSALLQLPEIIPRKKTDIVEDTILAMSLEDYADICIGGNCYSRGLAKGERRRVSIARELLTSPHLLFIDEPLYHLDSVSALLMMVTLKKLTSTGCTIVFTMYQSSTEVFGLFDRICLLSNGKELFFGETLACLQHFANAGFPCPVMQSPSDHFLRAINTDFDRIIAMCKNWQDDQGEFSSVNMDTAVAIRTLETTYKASTEAAAVEAMVTDLTEKEGPILKGQGKCKSFDTYCSTDMEIISDHVQRFKIFLASSDATYAPYGLHWNSIFKSWAFSLFRKGKSCSNFLLYIFYLFDEYWWISCSYQRSE